MPSATATRLLERAFTLPGCQLCRSTTYNALQAGIVGLPNVGKVWTRSGVPMHVLHAHAMHTG